MLTYEGFKHMDPDVFHGRELSLHDCTADKISFEQDTLRFYFPDGFWITPHHKENAFGKVAKSDASAVSFSVGNVDEITVRVFTKKWCRWRKTRVEDWRVEQLIAAVNSKKCTIEFITQYRSNYEQMWHCVIHSEKKPYYRECQLYLPGAEATFFWNDIRPDREW